MRIPLISAVSTKDGESNKNSRMTNCLAEQNPTGAQFAVTRPALVEADAQSGAGNGVVAFNNKLLFIFGGSLRDLDFGEIATIDDNRYDFTQSVM